MHGPRQSEFFKLCFSRPQGFMHLSHELPQGVPRNLSRQSFHLYPITISTRVAHFHLYITLEFCVGLLGTDSATEKCTKTLIKSTLAVGQLFGFFPMGSTLVRRWPPVEVPWYLIVSVTWISKRFSKEREARGHIISELSQSESGHTVQKVEVFNFLIFPSKANLWISTTS